MGPRFIATIAGVPGGMCSICFPADHDYEPLLISMWTAPHARRRGLGRRLLKACIAWCEAAGYKQLLLGVVQDNLAAATLYKSYGFVDTGRSEPLLSDPDKTIVWMRLPLSAPHPLTAEA